MKLPDILSVNQLKSFFSIVDDPQYMIIYALATFCGMRRESIVKLKKENVILDDGYIKIKDDKNVKRTQEGYGKDRTTPIPQMIIPLLRLWLEHNTESDFMFPSIYHRKDYISPNALTKKIIVDLKKAGINNPYVIDISGHKRHLYHFHTLRHSYATHYYNKTGDLVGLKANLGHTSIKTTQIYTHIAVEKRKEKVDQVFSPYHSSLLEEKDKAVSLEEIRHKNKIKELEMEMRLTQMKNIKIEVTEEK